MKMQHSYFLLLALALFGCNNPQTVGQNDDNGVQNISSYIQDKGYDDLAVATFAGGCFWCTEASFDRIQGVREVISGYSGGDKEYPTYDEVSRGRTTHAEAIMVYYDPAEVGFEKLLEVFFVAHDPTQLNRQGPDVGEQYRSAVFYHDEEQKQKTEDYIRMLEQTGAFPKPIVTEVAPYKSFWVAEDYHQNYYEQHPGNPYIQKVSRPKVEKVMKTFDSILKEGYRKEDKN